MRRFAARAAIAVAVLAVSAAGYSYSTFSRWASVPVTFFVNPANADVTPVAALAALQWGMDQWTNSGAAFSFQYGGPASDTAITLDGRNVVFFRNASSENAIATTYSWWDENEELVDSDIVFWDAPFTFFAGTSGCNAAANGAYIEDIATHEFGHALGLGHSSVAGATMFPSYNLCSQQFRTLAQDDLDGVRALYPSTGNTAPTVTIASPANGASFVQNTLISFAATAADTQDGDLTAQIQWTDNGSAIGSGGSLSLALATLGQHVIVARVTDSGGLETTAQVTITITSTGGGTGTLNASAGVAGGGAHRVLLTWSGVAGTYVDVYRNGARAYATTNDGAQNDYPGTYVPTSVTHTYKVCAFGTSTCTNTVSVSYGTGNTAPTVTISSPANGASYVQGATISLTATASDTQDGNLTGQIQWTDNGTPVGSGGSVSRTLTTLGVHVFVASVTDSGGLPGSSQVSVTVTAANTAPTVTIASPANGASYVQGATISLTATASDTQDGNLSGQIQWTDNGAPAGSGGSVSRTLTTLGVHVIVASVTDSGGLPGSSQVSVTVTAANTAPTVTISSPANGASFVQNTTISLTATASDTQDGNLTGQIQWTDNGAPAGSGGSVSRTLTTLGQHVIVATVTDSGGLQASSQVSVTVTAPSGTATLTGTPGFAGSGAHRSVLVWSGLTGAYVEVYRNNVRVYATSNGGSQLDYPGTSIPTSVTYTYKVCVYGTSTCTNTVSVSY